MSREDPQLKIRLPLELKEKITQSAADHGRSINSEVVARLEQSFEPEVKVSETLEFELMKRSYLDQAQQVKELKEMVEKLIKQLIDHPV
ncbi:Arc family DNA-binding protein [Acinetobacter variabilis]|uniref:Arc family DNA-binding protein n=1 Tax=Acinetobacter variabilis TaxID=70346 RepID=UPI0030FC11E3